MALARSRGHLSSEPFRPSAQPRLLSRRQRKPQDALFGALSTLGLSCLCCVSGAMDAAGLAVSLLGLAEPISKVIELARRTNNAAEASRLAGNEVGLINLYSVPGAAPQVEYVFRLLRRYPLTDGQCCTCTRISRQRNSNLDFKRRDLLASGSASKGEEIRKHPSLVIWVFSSSKRKSYFLGRSWSHSP